MKSLALFKNTTWFRGGRVMVVGLSMATAFRGAAADAVHQMSPFEVQAQSVEFEDWTKLRSPNFIVYTDASPRDVRPYLRQMELLHMVMQVTFGRRPLQHEPITVVLPSSRSDWRKMKSKGQVKWNVAVSRSARYSYISTVEYDWKARGIGVLWASLAGTLQSGMGLNLNFAVGKGVSYYYETMKQSDDGVRIGDANNRLGAAQRWGWLDWPEFFETKGNSAAYTRKSNFVFQFGAQAYAFVHFCLNSKDPEMVNRLLEWSELLDAGNTPTDERFQSVFGISYRELERILDKFLAGEKYDLKVFNFPPGTQDFVVTEIDVRAREMRDLFVLVQILNQHTEDSQVSLDAILRDGLSSEVLQPLLVEACLDHRRSPAALKILRELILADKGNTETFALAASLFLNSRQQGTGFDGRLSAEDQAQVLQWCERALILEPLHPGASETLTLALSLGPTVSLEQIEQIKERALAMDGNGDTDGLLVSMAVACWRYGDADRARRIVNLVLDSPFAYAGPKAAMQELLVKLNDGDV